MEWDGSSFVGLDVRSLGCRWVAAHEVSPHSARKQLEQLSPKQLLSSFPVIGPWP
jgi:hypothetical protein